VFWSLPSFTPGLGLSRRRNLTGKATAPISLSGRALDSAGKPIAGANIYLAAQNSNARRLAETKTDENGRYEFHDVPLPISRDPGDPAGGGFEVFGQADGFAFAWRPTKYYSPGPKSQSTNPVPPPDQPRAFDASDKIELDLTFAPPSRLSGLVIDDLGQPIPGARVELRYADRVPPAGFGDDFNHSMKGDQFDSLNERNIAPEEMKLRTTDASGRFQFAALPPNCRFDFDVHAPVFPSGESQLLRRAARKTKTDNWSLPTA